jgi:catechol 2,3-dioxygenase-like lactoylglutathione lyase family enzyme
MVPNQTDVLAGPAFLASATLRVPDASGAPEYHAALLGGVAQDDAVLLGSGTRLRYEEGTVGAWEVELQLAGTAPNDGDHAPGNDGKLRDPDGRAISLTTVEEISAPVDDAQPRLGHVTVESPDPLGTQAWYERLGFRVTEGLGDRFRWLRCNRIHHTVGIALGPRAATHHVAVEVPDRVALVDTCDRLSQLGEHVQYGPGRHMVGNNIFIYFLDRHGIRFEVFCELERVSDLERPPLIHERVERSRSVNLWGPQPVDGYWDAF